MIQSTVLDTFDLLEKPFTQCFATDANGNQDDLNTRVFRVSMTLKSPSYAAPNGFTITGLGNGLKCEKGYFVVKYTTKVAGQYRISVEIMQGFDINNNPNWQKIQDKNKQDESGSFERPATFVQPGQGVAYQIDSILSFRKACGAANANSIDCAYCLFPSITAGCAGNNFIPQAYAASQMLISAADAYSNTVDDACSGGIELTASVSALKQPQLQLTDCGTNTGGTQEIYCRSVVEVQRPTNYDLYTCADGTECKNQRCGDGSQCPYTCYADAPFYYVKFLPKVSGYYTMSVSLTSGVIPPTALGPIVVPVKSASVSPDDCIVFGQGLFGAVASQGVSFEIQPKDKYGNHHTQVRFHPPRPSLGALGHLVVFAAC